MNLLNFSAFLLLALPFAGVAAEHSVPPQARHNARHQELAQRAEGHVQLHKRFSGTKWTFYFTETGNRGSCGEYIRNGDFAVALNVHQYNLGECFKTITLQWGGVTRQARIMDMCPSCPYGGLDLSPGLWAQFAPQAKGIIWDGTWNFGGAPAPPPPPPPPTTTQPPPPPTTTWRPPPTTSSTRPRSTSSSRSTTRSSSALPSSTFSSGEGPRPTANLTDSTPPGNLELLDQVILQFANIVIDGGAARGA